MIKFVVGILILLVVMGIVPILIGTLMSRGTGKEHIDSISYNYLLGILAMFAIMQIYSVPMTLLQWKFSTLVMAFNVTLMVLCVLAILTGRVYLGNIVKKAQAVMRQIDCKWIGIVVLIYVPTIILSFYTMFIYGDDKTYLTMVHDIVESNTLYLIDPATGEQISWVSAKYALSSYWSFLAYLVEITGIHTQILCKTVLPFFIVPISYAVQGLIAAYLFRNDGRKMLVYMFFINLLNLFGCFSNYSVSYRLYTWSWQSKAFLAIIAIPFMFYYCCIIFEKESRIREYLYLGIIIIAACSATLTGAGLAIIMVLLLAAFYALIRKTLYPIIGAGVACIPAAAFMLLYLRYDIFVGWLRMQGVFHGIN